MILFRTTTATKGANEVLTVKRRDAVALDCT